ncbi:hypothetical protein M231_00913 [Tremella mesenterica]|uniref:DNA-directed RNA polymerase III subunit RPC5 n=1 Tax=Tremella mesenterica TaxID=5217 RepID=A0A4Q1BUI1_TREME|nr:hypothetical protein M231_00913 [Tremella mesenterica]
MPVKTTAPSSPVIEATQSTIDPHPEPPESFGPHLAHDEPMDADVPGPSSTYLPSQPTPPLPSSRPLPKHITSPEDDEIIEELPIYLSASLFPNLALFQYPLVQKALLSSWARERRKHISLRVKEDVGRVEVEVPVNEDEEFWRYEKASELSFTTDVGNEDGVVGGKEGKKGKKKEKWGEKMRLKSEMLPHKSGYYCGVIHEGALHLHPVSQQMQFRTSLAYLDDLSAPSKKKEEEDEEAKKKGKNARPPPVKKLLDDEDNDGSGSIRDFRKRMQVNEQRESQDPWVAYSWEDGLSDKVVRAYNHLITPTDKRKSLECTTRPLDYLDKTSMS